MGALWKARFRPQANVPFWLLWNLLGLILVVQCQVFLDRRPFYTIPIPGVSQLLLLGTAFLTLSFCVAAAASRPNGIRVLEAAGLAALCYAAVFAVFDLRPDIAVARDAAALASLLGIVLAFGPYVIRSYRPIALLALAIPVGLSLRPPPPPRQPNMTRRDVNTALARISVREFTGLAGPRTMPGGAIERLGDGFLVATPDGRFFRLEWTADNVRLTSRQLPLTLPLERAAFNKDASHLAPARAGENNGLLLRLTGIAVDTRSGRPRVFAAHQHWDAEADCMTLRVSVAPLPEEATSEPNAWTRVFETQPCLTLPRSFADDETGGRLAWLGDKLLLTVGNHGFDGLDESPALAQRSDNSYGKVLLLGQDGKSDVVSIGHRNPQGLHVDDDGKIWLTEHGPQGGDELNLIERGGNYGWPLVTYGTEYGRQSWRLAPSSESYDHGTFIEPVHAFVPSIGVANLIRVRADAVPAWKNDLLLASLKRESIYRVRMRGGRVTYAEPIALGRRVRDLAEGSNGYVAAWTDEATVLVMSPALTPPDGPTLFEQCWNCHGNQDRSAHLGPSLTGIVGRKVAAEDGFDYSPALKSAGGVWTEQRLDAFLADPGKFAPGSAMSFGAVPDAADRKRLIEYLKNRR